jgi:hypothetical protein
METKVTQYEEVRLNINGIDYYVNFSAEETWYWVDHGIGHYEYFGAPGIHEDWQWELDDVVISDVSLIEVDSDDNALMKPIESFDQAFAINIVNECLRYAKRYAEEPSDCGTNDGYDDIDAESYWADRNEYRYDNYYES